MSKVKNLIVKPIHKRDADRIVKRYHYSGKVTQNSQLNFGIFHQGKLMGAAQFGPSLVNRKMASSLSVGMNEYLELNRLAISDNLGKNTESRVLGVCLRIIKKTYPHMRCIISFADACQCGDGTIYKASNFKLLQVKRNTSLILLCEKDLELVRKYIKKPPIVIATKTLGHHTNSRGVGLRSLLSAESKPLNGYQMKYIYYFDKELEKTHKHISFDEIPKEVRMYKGEKIGALQSD